MRTNSRKPTVLIVDDNAKYLNSISAALEAEYDVIAATSAEAALNNLSPPPDIALVDVRLRENVEHDKSGIELLGRLRREMPQLPVVMATALSDSDIEDECIRAGAVDFLQKHRAGPAEVSSRLSIALRNFRNARENEDLRRQVEGHEIVGVSAHIRDLKRKINVIAEDSDSDVVVLLLGEQGTGKELVARAIHANGPRAASPFVAFSMAALPSHVIESELFGHERGSFTDAKERRIGLIEGAHKGVLFLDEIGDIEFNTQSKLLRFLQEREVQRVGSNAPIGVDVQIVAATNADLSRKMEEGTFRPELFGRLNQFQISLVPLRERPEDVPVLIDHFLALLRMKRKRITTLAPAAHEALLRYNWPGNVRELKSALESAQIQAQVSRHTTIEAVDLPAQVTGYAGSVGKQPGEPGFDIHEALARHELSHIRQALRVANGAKIEAGRLLGYNDRYTLGRRIGVIRERYPSVFTEFPDLAELYTRDVESPESAS